MMEEWMNDDVNLSGGVMMCLVSSQIIYPTGRCLDLPPESYSCTFNEQGRCTKLTGGFVIDAQQGSSGGLGGK